MSALHSLYSEPCCDVPVLVLEPVRPVNRKERAKAIKAATAFLRNIDRAASLHSDEGQNRVRALIEGLPGYMASVSVTPGSMAWALVEIAGPLEGQL